MKYEGKGYSWGKGLKIKIKCVFEIEEKVENTILFLKMNYLIFTCSLGKQAI